MTRPHVHAPIRSKRVQNVLHHRGCLIERVDTCRCGAARTMLFGWPDGRTTSTGWRKPEEERRG